MRENGAGTFKVQAPRVLKVSKGYATFPLSNAAKGLFVILLMLQVVTVGAVVMVRIRIES